MAMNGDLTSADLVTHMPAHVLGLGAPGLTPETVRDRLAQVGRHDPEAGHALADELAVTALRRIAEGVPNPSKYAADALTVLSAEFPRWCA